MVTSDLDLGNFFKGLDPNDLSGVPAIEQPTVNYPKVVFSIIICCLGLVANAVVLFVILALREFRKDVTHWYVLQLAIADSLFLISLPFKTAEDISLSWPFPEWMCKAKETVLFLNYYASITFLMIMSIDRYLAVCHMFSGAVQRLRKMRVAVTLSTCVWIVCLCMCVPVMLYTATAGNHPRCTCSYVFPSEEQHKAVNVTQECLDQGYTDIDLCVSILQPKEGSTAHCIIPSNALEKHLESLLLSGRNSSSDTGNKTALAQNVTTEGASDSNSNNNNNNNNNNNADPFGGFDFGSLDFTSLLEALEKDYNSGPVAGSGQSQEEEVTTLAVQRPATNVTNATASTSTANVHSEKAESPPPDCSYEKAPQGWKIFNLFNFFAMYVFPILVMIVCYGLIVKRLSLNNRPGGAEASSKANTKAQRGRRRVTIMCAALVSCFVVLWLPFHAGHLAKMVGINVPKEKAYICYNLSVAGSLMAYLSSALNPYLYTILGGNFATRWREATKGIRSRLESQSKSTSDRHLSSENETYKKRRNGSEGGKGGKHDLQVKEKGGKSQIESTSESTRFADTAKSNSTPL